MCQFFWPDSRRIRSIGGDIPSARGFADAVFTAKVLRAGERKPSTDVTRFSAIFTIHNAAVVF